MTDEQRYDGGMRVRRSVLGDAHVDRATAAAGPLDADFQEAITRFAWGTVWNDDGTDKRTRSMLTIALLAALGHEDELRMHLRATRNTGATAEDIRQALMHVAVYAGVPAANTAFKHAKEVLGDMGALPADKADDDRA